MALLPWGLLAAFWIFCVVLLLVPDFFEQFYKLVLATAHDTSAGKIKKAKSLDVHRKCKKFLDKRYLVVGGTKGIGRAIAISLADIGAAVDIAGPTGGDEVVQVMSTRSPASPNKKSSMFNFYKADLSTTGGCAEFVSSIDNASTFDGLVMTVGVWPDWSSLRTKEEYDRVIFTDIIARALVFRYLVEDKLLSRHAVVVNVLGSGLSVPFFFTKSLEKFKDPFKKVPTDYKASLSYIPVCTSAADAWLREAAKRHPTMTFIGTMAGFVWTQALVPNMGEVLSNVVMLCGELLRLVQTTESTALNHLTIIEYAKDVKRLNLSLWDPYLIARVPNKIASNDSYSEWLWETLEGIK